MFKTQGSQFCELRKSLALPPDGMHWCTKVSGCRINAALACVLRCSFVEEEDGNIEEMKQWEWRCNKQYMSWILYTGWNDIEEINVMLSLVDLENKEIMIQQNNSIALRNY